MGRPTVHTRHLLESTHTNTHKHKHDKHTTWPDKVRCGLTPWRESAPYFVGADSRARTARGERCMPNRSGPKLYAQRGQWDVNSSGWSPWSGMFTRPISELTRTMFPPLPSFRSVLAFDEHRNYLGIGCGLGRGLLEVQALMVHSTTSSTSGDNSTDAAAPFIVRLGSRSTITRTLFTIVQRFVDG
jgi:hypothetical protein